MSTALRDADGIQKNRLFAGTCVALFPTAFAFALVGGILDQLKMDFVLTNADVGIIGGAVLWGMASALVLVAPFLEKIGLRAAAIGAFFGHLIGVSLFLSAFFFTGSPNGFWILFLGAFVMGIGNGLIEAAGNPMVAAIYPDRKTVKLNHLHAFFPGGMVVGALLGAFLFQVGLSHWTLHISLMYIPIVVYGVMILPLQFPKTETAAAGIPIKEILVYTFTHPLVLLLIFIKMITLSLELGPMRWITDILTNAGVNGLLVFAWITGLMAVLRLFAGPVVERLAPTGILISAALLTGTGLLLFSVFDSGLVPLMLAATIFAFGVAFFFPTMVGLMSERFPKAGSVGIVLMIGMGMGASGTLQSQIGVVADRYMPDALNATQVVSVLEQVEVRYPTYRDTAAALSEAEAAESLGYQAADVTAVLDHNTKALEHYRAVGSLSGPLTGNALRALQTVQVAQEGALITEAGAVLRPADNYGGRMAFRWVAPVALIVAFFFLIMHLRDRKSGGYRAIRLDEVK